MGTQPISTLIQRLNNVKTTLKPISTSIQRWLNVESTLCAHWELSQVKFRRVKPEPQKIQNDSIVEPSQVELSQFWVKPKLPRIRKISSDKLIITYALEIPVDHFTVSLYMNLYMIQYWIRNQLPHKWSKINKNTAWFSGLRWTSKLCQYSD